jgi:hypothetical protein
MTDVDEALAPVLPRELTGISEAVRAVGAPPTPTLAAPYAIRLADPDADAEMVSEWMNGRIWWRRGSTTGRRRDGIAI